MTPLLPSSHADTPTGSLFAVMDSAGRVQVAHLGKTGRPLPTQSAWLCAQVQDLPALLRTAWLQVCASKSQPMHHLALAVAGSVQGDEVVLANLGWRLSISDLRKALQLDTLVVVNDFTALATSLPQLSTADYEALGHGVPQAGGVVGLIGPGEGLGMSGLIPAQDHHIITLSSEGGHNSFAPADEAEVAVLQAAWKSWAHVSVERLLSSEGLQFIWQTLGKAQRSKTASAAPVPSATEVITMAHHGDARCGQAVALFGRMLGTATANLALSLGAVGGVYLGGELLPRMGTLLAASGFRERFETKGRLSNYLAAVPTWVITSPHCVFTGLQVILSHHLRSSAAMPDQDGALLSRIRAMRDKLSRAELRVADHLLSHPRTFMNDPVADIARQAEVSQPTVIRFCRSLGFEGLSDFKLKLASGLTGVVPLRHSQVLVDDGAPDLSAKVLDNTVSAIVALRDALNGQAIGRAIELLRHAKRVEFHGVGNSHIVAVDGQYKFLRFGIPAMAHADSALQAMAAELLGPGDVVVAVSRSGAVPELLNAVGKAIKVGASVVAITASDSPLAHIATVTLAVDHVEGRTVQLSMVSRILHLLMIDVLAVGVAVQRTGEVKTPFGLREDAASWISHTR